MANDRVKEAVKLVENFLNQRNIQIEKIIIFGSQTRGDFKNDSDIDIAIVSKNFEGKDIFEKANMLKGLKWFLAERIPLPFDIIPLSFSEWNGPSLITQFAKTGFEVNLS